MQNMVGLRESISQQTQNICITFVQCWTNVEDVLQYTISLNAIYNNYQMKHASVITMLIFKCIFHCDNFTSDVALLKQFTKQFIYYYIRMVHVPPNFRKKLIYIL